MAMGVTSDPLVGQLKRDGVVDDEEVDLVTGQRDGPAAVDPMGFHAGYDALPCDL